MILACENKSRIDVNISIKSEVAGDGEFGYNIKILDSSIIATKNKSILIDNNFQLGDIVDREEDKLSENQLAKLSLLVAGLRDFDYYHKYDNSYISDDWTYELKIGSEEPIIIFKYYLSLDEFEELRNLFDYIFEICPIEIELRRFA